MQNKNKQQLRTDIYILIEKLYKDVVKFGFSDKWNQKKIEEQYKLLQEINVALGKYELSFTDEEIDYINKEKWLRPKQEDKLNEKR